MEKTAKALSYLFHPLLVPTYLLGLFRWGVPALFAPFQPAQFSAIHLMVFFVTFLLPVLNVFFFKFFGAISALSMPHRRERIIPLVFIALLYATMTFLFYSKFKVSLSDPFFNVLLGMDLLALVSAVATLFQKVSLHALGMGGLLGFLLPLNKAVENKALLLPTVVAFCIAGLVMSARLYLQAHTLPEVVRGALLGFLTSFLAVTLLF